MGLRDLTRSAARRRLVARLAPTLALLAGLLIIGVPAGAQTSLPPTRVYFFGDSLMVEAANYLYPSLNSQTTLVRVNAVTGTALCDWVYPRYQDQVDKYAPGGIMQLTRSDAPRVAVIQFSGNNFTPCAAPDASSDARLVENYSAMLRAAIGHLLGIGTQFVIVSRGPVGEAALADHDPLPGLLTVAYENVIASFNNTHVVYDADADTSVLNHGKFSMYLPCLSSEIANGECADISSGGLKGLNQVRSPDLRHFCPNEVGNLRGQLPAICTVWDSGALRFAQSFITQIWRDVPSSIPTSTQPYVTSVSPHAGPVGGATVVTVRGFGLSTVTSVAIVKYFNPVIDGVAFTAATPVRVFVPVTRFSVQSATRLSFVSPPLNQSTPADPGWEFVLVRTATSQSVTGLSSQGFDEG